MTTTRTTATRTTTAAPAHATTPSAGGTLSAVDDRFFRITASLFAPGFVFGAGVLLSTYDDEDEPPAQASRTSRS